MTLRLRDKRKREKIHKGYGICYREKDRSKVGMWEGGRVVEETGALDANKGLVGIYLLVST